MQRIHYDQWLEGVVLCGRQDYDHAHEDIGKVTCKDCLRLNATKTRRKREKMSNANELRKAFVESQGTAGKNGTE